MSVIDFMFSGRQQRMLRALLLHPNRQYGSNELIKIGGAGYGGGKRILDQFERSGIVLKTARGNQRLFSVNTHHPIFTELRSICTKTFGVSERIAAELAPFEKRIDLAFIFGSIAQGTDRFDSDVDLMVIGNIDVFELGEALERLERSFGRKVDLNLYTSDEWAKLQGDRVVAAILSNNRITLIER